MRIELLSSRALKTSRWKEYLYILLFVFIPLKTFSETYTLAVGESVTIEQSAYGGGYIDNVGLADYLDGHLSFTKNYDGTATITVKAYFDYTVTVQLVFIERYRFSGHTRAATYKRNVDIRCKYVKPSQTAKPTKVLLPERIRIPVYTTGAPYDYITPILEPYGAQGTTYTWSQSQGSAWFVARGQSDGRCWVTGRSPGVGSISVVVNNDSKNLSASAKIEIVDPNNLPPTEVFIPSSVEISTGKHTTLKPILAPENTSTSFTWKSDDDKIATVSGGKIFGGALGTTTITLTTGNELTAKCTVTVVSQGGKDDDEGEDVVTTGTVDGHDYVDLGLSVKWATADVGASKPEEKGTLYAWGETSGKSSYTWDNYEYGSSVLNVKNIGNDIKGTKYDAAYVNWGSNWRMPTETEIRDLISKCSFTEETVNGVSGFRATGPNGNSIFFPIGGQWWTSTWRQGSERSATFSLSTLPSGYVSATYSSDMRYKGYPIRPVTEASNQPTPPKEKIILTASPSGGEVSKGTTVTLKTGSVTGADIYYTLNGNTPSKSSTKYTSSGITINSDCTLKAIAYKEGYETSDVLTVKYTIKNIIPEPTGIEVEPSSKTIKVGESFTATYSVEPSNATTTVTWYSDDSGIASVSSSGKVTGVSPGTTYINAKTVNGKEDWCKVSVEAKTVEPTNINISPASKTIKVGESFTATYSLEPSNATTTVTWYSDDSGIASVSSSGKVTGVSPGTTYINAKTANGKEDWCRVTVEDNSDGVVSVAGGFDHSLIVKKDGSLWSCGSNGFGQLGDGTTTNRHNPVKIMSDVSTATAGGWNSFIVKKDGSLWACGDNYAGQLGDGTTTVRHSPVKIMNGVVSVAASEFHIITVKKDGSLWTCGENLCGQLGDGTKTYKLTPVKILDEVASVAAGGPKFIEGSLNHSLIVKKDGSLWACGSNDFGQLGDGTTKERDTPVKIMEGVAQVAAGSQYTLIVKKDGSLWSCGYNYYGCLGDGTTTERHNPVKIMDDVASVAAGAHHSLMVRKDGTLWACGSNNYGQLGDGTTTDRHIPIKIMDGVASVAAGEFHTLIVKKDGTLWACGNNKDGKLGDGTTTDRHNPVQISLKTVGISDMKKQSPNDGSIYNLNGQRVTNPKKGVYIRDGKKVLMR